MCRALASVWAMEEPEPSSRVYGEGEVSTISQQTGQEAREETEVGGLQGFKPSNGRQGGISVSLAGKHNGKSWCEWEN